MNSRSTAMDVTTPASRSKEPSCSNSGRSFALSRHSFNSRSEP